MGRVRKDCPVPGCQSKKLLKLSNHLSQVHNLKVRVPWLTKETFKAVKPTLPKSAISWSPEAVVDPTRPWWETQSLAPFETCSSMCVSGPTGAGKTQWVYRLLKNLNGMYVKDPPKKIMYCYGVYQPLYDEMEKTVPHLTFHSGLPAQTEIEEFANGQHGLIILDDLMHQVLEHKDIELLFTQGCHHRRL